MKTALTTEISSIEVIGENYIEELLALFDRFYQNVTKTKFVSDFKQKKWVIILRSNNDIVGFSTQTVFSQYIEGVETIFLYSGDTVVSPEYWQKSHLSGAFCHLMTYLIKEFPDSPLYWFLTSKGYRTFRYLPVFFKSFYPDIELDQHLKKVLDSVAENQFPSRYNPETGIIKPGKMDNLLKNTHYTIPDNRGNNQHINFFLKKNPGYINGDELACIAAIKKDNFKKTIFKVLENTEVTWNILEK